MFRKPFCVARHSLFSDQHNVFALPRAFRPYRPGRRAAANFNKQRLQVNLNLQSLFFVSAG